MLSAGKHSLQGEVARRCRDGKTKAVIQRRNWTPISPKKFPHGNFREGSFLHFAYEIHLAVNFIAGSGSKSRPPWPAPSCEEIFPFSGLLPQTPLLQILLRQLLQTTWGSKGAKPLLQRKMKTQTVGAFKKGTGCPLRHGESLGKAPAPTSADTP